VRHHARIEFDFAEGVFVSSDVLLQHAEQGLGLLGTEVDSLKILDFDLRLALLEQSAENEEEIPDVDADLHAVGVVLAVVGSVGQLDGGLGWICHRAQSVAGFAGGAKLASRVPSFRSQRSVLGE